MHHVSRGNMPLPMVDTLLKLQHICLPPVNINYIYYVIASFYMALKAISAANVT